MDNEWAKVLLPVILSGVGVALWDLYSTINDLENSIIHRELVEYRTEQMAERMDRMESRFEQFHEDYMHSDEDQ